MARISKALRQFIPKAQLSAIENNEEISEYIESLNELVNEMPSNYQQDGLGKNAFIFLHYFVGGTDWYITEKDREDEQLQAFGYTILNEDKQNAEFGYINIEELKQIPGVELDLYWIPKTVYDELETADEDKRPVPVEQAQKFSKYLALAIMHGYRKLSPEQKSEDKNIIAYTAASEKYDGFGTQTVEVTEYKTKNGEAIRKVSIPEKSYEWQTSRYSSGNRPAFSQQDFDAYKNTIFTKEEQPKIMEKETMIQTAEQTIKQDTVQESQQTEIQNAEIKNNQYMPQSDACTSVDTVVPASQKYEMFKAIETIDRRVNGVDEYVAEKLGYYVGSCSLEQKKEGLKCLCDAFSAEQVDAIAVAIYNIEQRGQSVIIGDQTGIGKGRIAAGLIRYGIMNGKLPIFLTEKPNLFSDIFRDLVAIGSDDAIPLETLQGMREVKRKPKVKSKEEDEEFDDEDENEEEEVIISDTEMVPYYKKNKNYEKDIIGKKRSIPFIVNARGKNTHVKDSEGNIIYKALDSSDLNRAIFSLTVPKGYDFVLATYSQFRGAELTDKMNFLKSIAQGSIIIMDESHNASGSSNTGKYLKDVLAKADGATFLSATFAKRPDNMPIYASKTAIKEASLNDEQLISAITNGGVALQEILSSQLTAEGQMIRRERSFEGIKVDYVTLDAEGQRKFTTYNNLDKELEHRAISDTATEIIREIIKFQNEYVNPEIEAMDKIAKAEAEQIEGRQGTKDAGINNTPVFNGIFQLINQLLFSIKAESVADIAINEMRKGKKPIIAFASTMESFLNQMTNDSGLPVEDNDVINADFSVVLKRRLESTLKFTKILPNGEREQLKLDVNDFSDSARNEYFRLLEKISKSVVGISISPIDVIVQKIKAAGFSVEEVTGRTRMLKVNDDGTAIVKSRTKPNAFDAFTKFNNNEVDCLLINQSGSTGASAHAIPTKKVPANQVKPRVMIILQAELNINTEVQKRGRINRTGQILKPEYIYVTSSIPAEKRLMMMLQKKLKSLDANTTSNQKQSKALLDSDDFLNKYGDQVVVDYLKENKELNEMIDDPLKLKQDGSDEDEYKGKDKKEKKGVDIPDKAHKVSGRVAILSVKQQEDFYSEMINRYKATIEFLNSSGENDLEVESLDLQATTLEKEVVVMGKGGESLFARNSILEKIEANALKKPYKKIELESIINQALDNHTAQSLNESLQKDFQVFQEAAYNTEYNEIVERYTNLENNIENEARYRRLAEKGATESEKREYVLTRKQEISEAKQLSLERLTLAYENRKNVINKLFKFFYVGKVIGYPTKTYAIDNTYVKGIFTGFGINKTVKNPWAPSAIKLNIALASADKNIVLPASKQDIINAIQAITYGEIVRYDQETTLDNWDEIIREKSKDRQIRYVVTGNILQAFAKPELKGKLISYTTSDGGVKKGILLPDHFNPTQVKSGVGDAPTSLKVTVPIVKALPIIRSMMDGRVMTTNNNISIFRAMGKSAYRVIMNKSVQKYGKYFLNPLLMAVTVDKKFSTIGGNMEAYVEERKIDNLVNILQDEFGETVNLTQAEFDMIKGDIQVDYDDETNYRKDDVIEKLTESDKKMQEELEAEKAKVEESRAREDEETRAEIEAEIEQKTEELYNAEMEARRLKIENKIMKLYQLLSK